MGKSEMEIVGLEEGWVLMKTGIQKLINDLEGNSAKSGYLFETDEYTRLYTTIYNMCNQKCPYDHSEQLYRRYKETLDRYLKYNVLPALRAKHDEFMLKELVKGWENYNVMVRWLSRFFNYLDRYFTHRRSLPTLNIVGLKCFKDMVFKVVRYNVRDAVIGLIGREREGEHIDRALVKNVLDIFVIIGMGNMGFYERDFESPMLDDTASYYSRKAASWIVEDSCPIYMFKAEEGLKRENERVAHYLHSSSKKKLLETVRNALLSQYPTGCYALLRDDKVEDLSRMYRLLCTIPKGLQPVAAVFKQHVTSEGISLVNQAEDAARTKKADKKDSVCGQEQAFVRKAIELHDKCLQYVNDCFMNHSLFHKALREAFEVFCNKEVAGTTTAELFATFCDNILKNGGTEKLSDEDVEKTLQKFAKLVVYINDKDLFAEFYRKKLARRLLFGRSASDDHERSILTKLKLQFGARFTSKLEGMVTDLMLAKESQSSFADYSNDNPKVHLGIDLSVTVLTSVLWPTYTSSELNLPTEMVKCVEVFTQFYQTSTNHRKLTWIYSLGTCNIIGSFDTKKIEFIVMPYQAATLLLFNSFERLSYSEIKSQLNLADEEVIRVLYSLSCAKYRILNKEPDNKTVSESDYFEFNSKFTDKMRKIKIPLPTADEKKKVTEVVDNDRRHLIDSCIVRVMKSRKVLSHQKLVMECVGQLSKMFKPDLKAIKKRIDDLINREYMERDKEDPNLYKYLA